MRRDEITFYVDFHLNDGLGQRDYIGYIISLVWEWILWLAKANWCNH